jgi:hypothetical protein
MLVTLSSRGCCHIFLVFIHHCLHYVLTAAFYFLDSTRINFKREILRPLSTTKFLMLWIGTEIHRTCCFLCVHCVWCCYIAFRQSRGVRRLAIHRVVAIGRLIYQVYVFTIQTCSFSVAFTILFL